MVLSIMCKGKELRLSVSVNLARSLLNLVLFILKVLSTKV